MFDFPLFLAFNSLSIRWTCSATGQTPMATGITTGRRTTARTTHSSRRPAYTTATLNVQSWWASRALAKSKYMPGSDDCSWIINNNSNNNNTTTTRTKTTTTTKTKTTTKGIVCWRESTCTSGSDDRSWIIININNTNNNNNNSKKDDDKSNKMFFRSREV